MSTSTSGSSSAQPQELFSEEQQTWLQELLNRHTEVVVQVVVSFPQLSSVSVPTVISATAGGASVGAAATSQLSMCTTSVSVSPSSSAGASAGLFSGPSAGLDELWLSWSVLLPSF